MLKQLVVISGLLLMAACAPPAASTAAITIENARIMEPPPGATTAAAYFTLRNDGPADQLAGASSPVAASAMLHETRNEAGMMSMHHMEGIDLPAGGVIEFAPGGRHIMLTGLTQPLVAGGLHPITFTFVHGEPITVNFPVKAP
jgi:copper(I)-binding protein